MNGWVVSPDLVRALLVREAMRSGADREQALRVAAAVQKKYGIWGGADELGFEAYIDAFTDAAALIGEEETTDG